VMPIRVAALILLLSCAGLPAQDVYEQNEIDPTWVKSKPRMNRYGLNCVDYRDSKQHLRATEKFSNDKLVHRVLFKNDVQDGFEREWSIHGVARTVIPYQNGLIHGIARKWDEKGVLVACYRMNRGTGLAQEFYSPNLIKSEVEYIAGKMNGTGIEYYPNGMISSFNKYEAGKLIGQGFAFHKNGALYCFGEATDGQLSGPVIYLTADGSIQRFSFWIDGAKKTQAEYDAEIPTYFPRLSGPFDNPEVLKNYALKALESAKESFGVQPRRVMGPEDIKE